MGFFQAKALINLASAFAQAGHQEQAQSAWREAEDMIAAGGFGWFQQRTLASRHLAKTFTRHQRWQEAERVTRGMKDLYWQPRTMRSLAKALAAHGRWQEAERITLAIDDAAYQAVALRGLVTSFARAHFLQEAERIALALSDQADQVMAFSGIAIVQLQAGDQWHAQRFQQSAAERMAALSLDGYGVRTLRELAIVLARARQWQDAERLAACIKLAIVQVGVLQDVALLATKAGEREVAQHLFQEAGTIMAALAPSEQARASYYLATALAQAGLWHEAEHLASTIDEDFYQAHQVFEEIVTTLARTHRWQEAEKMAGSIKRSGYRARALHSLATALAQAHHWQEASRIAASIESGLEQRLASIDLAIISAQTGRHSQAHQRWQEARQRVTALADVSQRDVMSYRLAGALAQARLWQEAEEVAQDVTHDVHRGEAYYDVATALAHAQQWPEAEKMIRAMAIL